jgi:hypothetical protein
LINWASRTMVNVSSEDDGAADKENADEAGAGGQNLGGDRYHAGRSAGAAVRGQGAAVSRAGRTAGDTPLKVWRLSP